MPSIARMRTSFSSFATGWRRAEALGQQQPIANQAEAVPPRAAAARNHHHPEAQRTDAVFALFIEQEGVHPSSDGPALPSRSSPGGHRVTNLSRQQPYAAFSATAFSATAFSVAVFVAAAFATGSSCLWFGFGQNPGFVLCRFRALQKNAEKYVF